MELYKIDITPLSMFRDRPSSYTVFGAVSWAYSILYGEEELKQLLNRFAEGDIPFLVSSILPKDGNTYYFPKPNLKARWENSSNDFKKLKKISYVDWELLQQVLEGSIKDELELNKELKKKIGEEELSFFETDAVPHASIDRLSNSTTGSGGLYFEEVVAVEEGYILVAVADNEIKEKLESIFELLQDIGLGGNRSVGYGRVMFGKFEPFGVVEKYFTNKTNRFITLSPVIPEKNTYDLGNSYYDYFSFRGAVDNNYGFKNKDIWKDKVIYLKEGATLTVKNPKSFYGQFYPAKDINGERIYQYGLAFPLYIQGG